MTTGRVERDSVVGTERDRETLPADAPTARETPAPRRSRIAVAAHVASLVGTFAVLFYANRDQWFFGDEWEFLGHRGVLHGDKSIWAPHTDHWSTVPILIYRALFNLYGLKTYAPYVVVLLLLHVAVTHLLWRLMSAVGADLVISTLLAAVYGLLGAGYENLLWAFQIGFVGAVAVGLVTVLLVNHAGRWNGRDWAGWVVSVVGLMFSGIGVTMVAVAGLTVLFRRGLRDAALTVVVPGVVYLVWLGLVGHQSLGSEHHTMNDIFAYPDYIWTGMRAAVEQAVGFPGCGPLLVLGLTAWMLRRGDLASGAAAPAFAGAIGVIALYSIIAVGRTSLGVEQSAASRYVYITIALALPATSLALSQLAGNAGAQRGVISFFLLLVVIHNGSVLRVQARAQDDLEQHLKARILAAAQLVSSSAVILNDHPEPEYDPDIVVSDLRRMERERRLPAAGGISDFDRLTAAAALQFTASREPSRLTSQPADDGVVGATEVREPSGCLLLTPTATTTEIHLTVPAPFAVTVISQADGDLTGFLRTFGPPVLTSPPQVYKLEAGVPLHVSASAAVDQVVVRVPSSAPTEVCGVQ